MTGEESSAGPESPSGTERAGPEPLSGTERAVLTAGREWIRDHEGWLCELLAELVARPSVTGEEGSHDDPGSVVGALHGSLAGTLTRSTIDVQRVAGRSPRENCYAVLEGVSDELLLCTSHTDTVAPGDATEWPGDDPFALAEGTVRRVAPRTVELAVDGTRERRTIREAYDRVWDRRTGESRTALVGRGAYDNKAAVVSLVGALAAVEAGLAETGTELGGTLVHAHLVGEEVAQSGAKAMVGAGDRRGWLGRRWPDPDGAVVVVDGAYGYVPAVGHRGLAWITLRAEGESTHAATPHLGRNAVLGAARALADADGLRGAIADPFVDDELLGALTVAAGTTVVGGDVTRDRDGRIDRTGVNAVPDWCETTIDVRFPRWEGHPDGAAAIREGLETAVEEHASARADGVEFEATVDPEEYFPPVAIADSRAAAREHPLVARALAATESTVGYDPGVVVAPGVTDAAVIAPATRLPTVVEYGAAGAFSHEPLEYVERESVIAGAEALAELAVRQLGVVDDGNAAGDADDDGNAARDADDDGNAAEGR